MSARVEAHDWAATPLGSIETWPSRLALMVEQTLANPFVAWLACGPTRIVIYNDAATTLFGPHHPDALGRPFREACPAADLAMGRLYDRAFGGESLHAADLSFDGSANDDQRFDAYLTPVRDAEGRVVAAHVVGFEIGARLRKDRERGLQSERLKEGEQSLRAIYDGALSPDGILLEADRVSLDFAGGKWVGRREEVVGLPLRDTVWFAHTPGAPEALDAAVARAAEGEFVRYDVRVLRPPGETVVIDFSLRPVRDESGKVAHIVTEGRIVSELVGAQTALRESEERFAQFATSSSDGLWIRDAATLAMEYVSPAIHTIYGVPPDSLLGDVERWAASIVPEDRATARHHLEQARQGNAITHEFRIRRPTDDAVRWIRDTDFPLRDESGRVQRIGGIAQDVTEARHLRERQSVLVAELQHRTRNLMGVISSIANRTMAGSADLADFHDRFTDRLAALARAQGLLSRLGEGERVTFDELIHAEMAAIDGAAAKVTLDGPAGVALRSSTVQTFALALHELSTNAGNYGAFAQPAGRLDIRWRVERAVKDGRPWLHMDWRERGVTIRQAEVAPPGGGSGRDLIERALPYQLGATTTFEITADGVHCAIALPVSERRTAA